MATMAKKSTKKFLILLILLIGILSLARTLFLNLNASLIDFEIYYKSAQIIFNGGNPYIHPNPTAFPLFLYLISPLTLVNLTQASNIWTILNGLFAIGSVFILARYKRLDLLKLSIFFLLFIISFPFKFTLGMGQVNLLALFLITVFIFLHDKKNIASNIAITLAGIVKIFPFIFYLISFDKEKIKYLVFFGTIFILISYVINPDVFIYFVREVLVPNLASSKGEIYYNQNLDGLIARLSISPLIGLILKLVVLISGLIIFLNKNHSFEKRVSTIIVTLLLVSSVTWQHHLLFLAIPFYFLLAGFKKRKHQILLFISYLLTSYNIKSPESNGFLEGLVLSHAVLGLMLLFILTFVYEDKE